jgi:sorbitol-specific phosphotransferase system component IIC
VIAAPAPGRSTLPDQLIVYAALAAPAGLVSASLLLELTLALACVGVTVKIVRGRVTSRAESDRPL